jgi:hypothetical protein
MASVCLIVGGAAAVLTVVFAGARVCLNKIIPLALAFPSPPILIHGCLSFSLAISVSTGVEVVPITLFRPTFSTVFLRPSPFRLQISYSPLVRIPLLVDLVAVIAPWWLF